MSNSIPVYLYSSFYMVEDSKNSFYGNGLLYVDKTTGSPNYSQTQKGGLIWICVLNRADPTKKPVFNQVLESNTDVPAGLAALLNSDHILIAVICGSTSNFPQGDLFKTLIKSGAGPHLKKLERMATYNACGVVENTRYTLICVPGTGIAGIESSGFNIPTSFYSPNSGGGNTPSRGYQMLDFVPGPDGYAPILIG